MSVIGRKPFVNKIIDRCTKEQAQKVIDLMDYLGTPQLVALYGDDNRISSSNIGVNYVTLKMNETLALIPTGILIYLDDSHCGFFVVNVNSDNIIEYTIDPVNRTYIIINEYLTVEELRQVCGDRISEINDMDVAGSQATTTVIKDALTNINGRVLTNYEATLHEAEEGVVNDYTYYKITKSGNDLTEEEATAYMEYMTGSSFLPSYNFEKPQNSLFIMADQSTWKPQWMASGTFKGLYLFKLAEAGGGTGLPDATKVGQALVSDENLEPIWADSVAKAENLVGVPETNDAMYSSGPTGGLADITTGEEAYLNEIKGYSIVWNQLINNSSVNADNSHIYIMVSNSDGTMSLIKDSATSVTSSYKLYDLTLMFGGNDKIPFEVLASNSSTTTEYVANGTMPEQTYKTTYGFARLFANVDLVNAPYDAGTIKNVKVNKLVETGQNLWDGSTMEETGLQLLAGYRYEIYLGITATSNKVSRTFNGSSWTDATLTRYQRADGKYIWTYTPEKNCWIKSKSTSLSIAFVGFVHSGNYCLTTGTVNNSSYAITNVTIPAYQKHEYPSGEDTLGISGLNGLASEFEEGMIYDTVDTTRVGVLDFEDYWDVMTWDGDNLFWRLSINDVPNYNLNKISYFLSQKGYDIDTISSMTGNEEDDGAGIAIYGGNLSSSQKPEGLLLYPLSTPVETGQPVFTPIRIDVNDMGSEYFIQPTNANCPVNQKSIYLENLKDKLVNLSTTEVEAKDYSYSYPPLEALRIDNSYYRLLKLGSVNHNYAIAIGLGSQSNASNNSASVAIGVAASAAGMASVSVGHAATCYTNGNYSVAIGSTTTVSQSDNVVIGYYAQITAHKYSVAIGSNSENKAHNAVAIGYNSKSYIEYGVSFDGNSAKSSCRTLLLYDADKIFFRNEQMSNTKTTFVSYSQGHFLSEYIQNNVLSLSEDSGTFVSGDTFTGSEIKGVHVTFIIYSSNANPSIVGLDLAKYDSGNNFGYDAYGRANVAGTVVDIHATINSTGNVVIDIPTGATNIVALYYLR